MCMSQSDSTERRAMALHEVDLGLIPYGYLALYSETTFSRLGDLHGMLGLNPG